jgi:2-polyprenyl-3-methyl-5-hydroxy-6-metoxy-1,4-benzoquinol methylase
LKFKIKQLSQYQSTRDEAIVALCDGKKVLHIGATDAPYTKPKLDAGLLLHAKIDKVADDVLGIDIDQAAIDYLKEQGMSNIIAFDMNKLEALDYAPDVIIFGETIEHLMNQELAISNLKQIMSPTTNLVVSTPNALWINKIIDTLLQTEHQHPDHKVVFSLATLKNLFEANDMVVKEMYYTFLNRKRTGITKKIKKTFCKLFPGFSETLLFVVSKS